MFPDGNWMGIVEAHKLADKLHGVVMILHHLLARALRAGFFYCRASREATSPILQAMPRRGSYPRSRPGGKPQ